MGNADGLSRLPLEGSTGWSDDCCEINFIHSENNQVVNQELIAIETEKDSKLKELKEFLMTGWPSNISKDFKKYHQLKNSLSCQDKLLFYGDRVIIPESLQIEVLKLLHDTHIGMVRMKSLARETVWWIGINNCIEQFCRECIECNIHAKHTKDCDNFEWPSTTEPYERIHLDLFYYGKHEFLISCDSFSKWLDIHVLSNSKAKTVINKLRDQFTIFGLPTSICTDNGPPFSSHEFSLFCEGNGITLLHSPPYHPESNGLAERSVQTVKNYLKKSSETFVNYLNYNNGVDIKDVINKFLFNYRNTPSTVTGLSPANIVLNYNSLTPLKKLNKKVVKSKKKVRFVLHDEASNRSQNQSKKNNFELLQGQEVLYRNTHNKLEPKWMEAKIVKRLSTLMYQISLKDTYRTAHRNQIKVFNKKLRNAEFIPIRPALSFDWECRKQLKKQPKRKIRTEPHTSRSTRTKHYLREVHKCKKK